jgi:hypothetical protein
MRKYSLQEDPQWRVRAGSEAPTDIPHRPSIAADEETTLHEVDQDGLNSKSVYDVVQ